MGESNTTQSASGIGFFGLLAILFIGLKLTGYITWSWWAVTAPLWAPVTFFICIAVAFAIFSVLTKGR